MNRTLSDRARCFDAGAWVSIKALAFGVSSLSGSGHRALPSDRELPCRSSHQHRRHEFHVTIDVYYSDMRRHNPAQFSSILGFAKYLRSSTHVHDTGGQRWFAAPVSKKSSSSVVCDETGSNPVISASAKVDYRKKLKNIVSNKVPPQYICFKSKGEHRCRLKVLGRIVEASGGSWDEAMQAAAKESYEELKNAKRSQGRVPKALVLKNEKPTEGAEWVELGRVGGQEAVPHPWAEEVPKLAHDLERLVLGKGGRQPCAIEDTVAGRPFNPYLRRIAQPGEAPGPCTL